MTWAFLERKVGTGDVIKPSLVIYRSPHTLNMDDGKFKLKQVKEAKGLRQTFKAINSAIAYLQFRPEGIFLKIIIILNSSLKLSFHFVSSTWSLGPSLSSIWGSLKKGHWQEQIRNSYFVVFFREWMIFLYFLLQNKINQPHPLNYSAFQREKDAAIS